MATDTQTIINENISTVKELRDEIKRLKDSLVTAKEGSQEWTDTVKELTAAQEKLTTINNAHKQSVDAAKDSIVGMEREYKALYDTYKLLSEEQRNSDFGKNMADQLSTLHEKLNKTKQGVGNFKDNIGNYTNSVMDAFKKLGMSAKDLKNPMSVLNGGLGNFKESAKNAFKEGKNMWTGFKNLSTATKVLGGGFAVATAAVVGFVKITKDAIKNNEELSMRMQESMAVLQPIKDWWANFKDTIGSWGVAAVEAVSGWIAKVSPAAAAAQELAHAQNELVKTRREYNKLNADDNIVVERLRDEAAMTDDYTTKLEKLKEAKQKQEEIDKRNVELAKEELRLLEERAKQSPNNAEANEALTQSYIKLAEAEAKVLANNRQYDKQITSINKSQVSEAAARAKKIKDEADTIIERLRIEALTEEEIRTEQYNKELKALKKQYGNTKKYRDAAADLEKEYNKDIEKIRNERLSKENRYADNITKSLLSSLNKLEGALDLTLQFESGRLDDFVKEAQAIGGKLGEDGLFSVFIPDLKGADGKIRKEVQTFAAIFDVALDEVADNETLVDAVNAALMEQQIAVDDAKRAIVDYNDSIRNLRFEEKKLKDNFEAVNGVIYDLNNPNLEFNLLESLNNGDLDAIANFTEKIQAKRNEDLNRQREYLIESVRNAKAYFDEINAIETTSDEEKLQANIAYYQALDALRQHDLEAAQAANDRHLELDADLKASKEELFATITSGLQSSMSSINSLLQSEVQEGKLNEQQVKKRKNLMKTLEAISLAAAVAQIAADTASGIMGVWKGFGLEQAVNAETAAATGPAAAATLAALNAKSLVSAGIKTGIIATAGAANLASAITGSISNFKSINSLGDSGSGDASIYSAPSMSDSTPYSYTRTVQTQQEQDALNQPTIVSVVDIENALNKRKVRTEETTF